MKLYGLMGYPLTHSFSKTFFTQKFSDLNLTDHYYFNFPLQEIAHFPVFIKNHPSIQGLNITIPHKQQITKFLHRLHPQADKAKAVNTIKIHQNKIIGYNTDVPAFQQTLLPFLTSSVNNALILGTGVASAAVQLVLNNLQIPFKVASRNPTENQISYSQITPQFLARHLLIVNTTPLGMHPHINQKPLLPYHALTPQHILYDLIYNPAETEFLKEGKGKKAITINGLQMLIAQAELSWQIWKEK